jgi:hypothetical protein
MDKSSDKIEVTCVRVDKDADGAVTASFVGTHTKAIFSLRTPPGGGREYAVGTVYTIGIDEPGLALKSAPFLDNEKVSDQVALAAGRVLQRPEKVSPLYEDGGGSAQDRQTPTPPP